MSFKQLLSAYVGRTGKNLTAFGTAIGAPQLPGFSGGAGAAMQNWASPQNQARNLPLVPVAPRPTAPSPYANAFSSIPLVRQSFPQSNPQPNPQPNPPPVVKPNTGGQGQVQNTADTYNNNPDVAYTRGFYENYADQIRSYDPLVEGAYATGKSDIENAVSQAEAAGVAQKKGINTGYGDVLKSQLQTYQDVNRQRQGIFSSLGTLDSSAFGEQQFRGDQDYGEQRGKVEQAQNQDLGAVDTAVSGFTNNAKTGLIQLAAQFQQGKNLLAQALASNDLEGARAVNTIIEEIRQKAQGLAGQLGSTVSTVQGVKSRAYAPSASDLAFQSQYTPSQAQTQGQGYISPGKKYKSYQEYLMDPNAK